jgi:tRNA(Ile)-lysidine synthase TilS/MesJ
MIKKGDKVQYKKTRDFKGVVLGDILKFVLNKFDFYLTNSNKFRAERDKFKSIKIAIVSSIDSEAEKIVKTLINGNASELKKFLPIQGKKIKPLYLFLDEEILLYAKLKNLKFRKEKNRKDKIQKFEDEFERKHPEVKRAIVNTVLKLYNQEE